MSNDSEPRIGLLRLEKQAHFIQEIREHRTERHEMSETSANAHIAVAERQFAVPARWASVTAMVTVLALVAGILAVCSLDVNPWVQIAGLLALAGGVGVLLRPLIVSLAKKLAAGI